MAVEQEYWKKVQDDVALNDYPDVDDTAIQFPPSIDIAYAVCSKECGHAEFIVDGSTQVCYYCGKLMFRTAIRQYSLNGNLNAPDD